MNIVQAMKNGQGHAVYADGDHEAVISLNGKQPDGSLTWNVTEHTKDVEHTSGVNLTIREALITLRSANVQLDRGWLPDRTKEEEA